MTIRIPDPKANTTTEAYLAYKAGYLEESELKPSLYEPYLHFDAWLAYWAGLTTTYPGFSKNKFDINTLAKGSITVVDGVATGTTRDFYLEFQNGIELVKTAPVMSITATAYHDGETLSGNGINFRAVYTDGTSYNIVGFPNSTTEATTKTGTTDGSKILDHIDIVYGAGGTNVWHLSDIQIEEGSVPTEYEPFDAPEMLCDEEALVAYLAGVTDTYPEEIKDPYDVRIVGYLRHLASIRWPEPDYPVNNEEFYLSTMDSTHISNSEPSADIELDTAEAKLISVEAYGDTVQQTYTGKNLVGFSSPDVVANATYTVNNGVYTITATATSLSIRFPLLKNIPAGTYTWSGSIAGFTASPRKSDGTSLGVNSNAYPYTFTISEDMAYMTFFAAVTVGQTLTLDLAQFMIESGGSATSFEPYVGGIPAPNPDYPQDIRVVTGAQTVTVCGKNLFNKDGGNILNTVVDANGIGSNVPSSYRTVFAPCQPNTTYTVSKALDSTRNRFCIAYTKTTPTYNMSEVYGKIVDNTKSALTITTGADAKYIVAYVWISGGSVSADDMVASVQIEPGATATTYEPYQSSDYEINLGKNLFSGNYSQFDNTGGTGTLYDYFKLPKSGDYTLTITAKNDIGAQSPQKFIGFTTQGGDATGGYVWAFAGSTVMQKGDVRSIRNTYQGNRLGYISMYPNNATILQWFMENFDIQLEIGDTATDFAPYFTPIELCKIGSYQDYIYKDGDDWYVHKTTGRCDFNSSTPFARTATKNFVLVYNASSPFYGLLALGEPSYQSFCNMFTFQRNGTTWAGAGKCGFNAGGAFWLMHTQNIDTVGELQTWLGSNPTFVYYPLATPTDTKITDEALIGQLEALADADTYDKKTNIRVTATDPNLPALLKVEAYKY